MRPEIRMLSLKIKASLLRICSLYKITSIRFYVEVNGRKLCIVCTLTPPRTSRLLFATFH